MEESKKNPYHSTTGPQPLLYHNMHYWRTKKIIMAHQHSDLIGALGRQSMLWLEQLAKQFVPWLGKTHVTTPFGEYMHCHIDLWSIGWQNYKAVYISLKESQDVNNVISGMKKMNWSWTTILQQHALQSWNIEEWHKVAWLDCHK